MSSFYVCQPDATWFGLYWEKKRLKTNCEGSAWPRGRKKHPFCRRTNGVSVRSAGIPRDPEQPCHRAGSCHSQGGLKAEQAGRICKGVFLLPACWPESLSARQPAGQTSSRHIGGAVRAAKAMGQHQFGGE